MLQFILSKSETEDDDLTLLLDEDGAETLLNLIHSAKRTGHEHLIENEFLGEGLTNEGNPHALKHILIDWFTRD
jgi:hypothetical protein